MSEMNKYGSHREHCEHTDYSTAVEELRDGIFYSAVMVCRIRSHWKARKKNGDKKIQYVARAHDVMIMKVRFYQWMSEQVSAFHIPVRTAEYYDDAREGLAYTIYRKFRPVIQRTRELLAEVDPWIDTQNRFTYRPERPVNGHVEVSSEQVMVVWASVKPVRGDPRSGDHEEPAGMLALDVPGHEQGKKSKAPRSQTSQPAAKRSANSLGKASGS